MLVCCGLMLLAKSTQTGRTLEGVELVNPFT